MQLSINEHTPLDDLKEVVESEIKEWHFHIYFLQDNQKQRSEALALRDAVLNLRRQGAFIAVPLKTVNLGPRGPHPAGSYEIWCPSESFVTLYSYLCQNRGNLSILVHPLTREEQAQVAFSSSIQKAWIGPPWPIDLSKLPKFSESIPLQYPSLGVGYSSTQPQPTLSERRKRGAELEELLKHEPDAAPAPASFI